MLVTNKGATRIATVGWPNLTAPRVCLMARDGVVPTKAINFFDELDEYAGSGYDGGFEGTSRQTPGSLAVNEDDANGRAELDAANATFTGVAGPDPIAPFVTVIEEVTSDAASAVIACIPTLAAAAARDITAASEASSASFTTGAAHNLATDDLVYLTGLAGGTWAALNGTIQKVTVVDADEFTIAVNSTAFGTATFATAEVYVPLAMNAAPVEVQWDAEGLVQLVPATAAVTS